MSAHIEYGTEADGSASTEYCSDCYMNGKFTNEMSMEEMIDYCTPYMVKAFPGMTDEQARDEMCALFPNLKRWRQAQE